MNKETLQFTFMGLPAYNMTINQSMGDVNPVYGHFTEPSVAYIRSEPGPVTVGFHLLYNNYVFDMLQRQTRGCLSNFISAYPSGVCQHCSSYFPAGLLICKSCGGYVSDEVVSLKSSRYELIYISTDEILLPRDDTARLVDMEIALIDEPNDFVSMLNFEILPTGFNLNEEYILCNSCLCIVGADSICPNCGSARLPFSEVIKIDRECIFCHTKTHDGIMCKNCGASLAGMSYREYKLLNL